MTNTMVVHNMVELNNNIFTPLSFVTFLLDNTCTYVHLTEDRILILNYNKLIRLYIIKNIAACFKNNNITILSKILNN